MMEIDRIIKGKKYNISCKEYLPEEKKHIKEIIIACHGFAGDKASSAIEMLANKMVKHNICVICFDFPGHGESEVEADELTIQNCIDDINEIEKYVNNSFNNLPISIFATSFGAYICLLNIAQNDKKYKNIILRSPAINMYDIYAHTLFKDRIDDYIKNGYIKFGFEREMKIPYSFLEELKANDIFKIYSKINIPKLYIIQGDKDEIAPIEDTKTFKKLNDDNIELYIISGANHRMKQPGELEKVIEYSEKIIIEGE